MRRTDPVHNLFDLIFEATLRNQGVAGEKRGCQCLGIALRADRHVRKFATKLILAYRNQCGCRRMGNPVERFSIDFDDLCVA
jgi:hypothetical protein